MKKKILTVLNSLLSGELTAISQYMSHSELCENWGYSKLHVNIKKKAMDEMHHAVWLIDRIFFYEGSPTESKLHAQKIGKTVTEIISYDNNYVSDAVYEYNKAIKLAHEFDDQGTVELLTRILKTEESHVNWTENQQTQIEQMGMEKYLINQTDFIAN